MIVHSVQIPHNERLYSLESFESIFSFMRVFSRSVHHPYWSLFSAPTAHHRMATCPAEDWEFTVWVEASQMKTQAMSLCRQMTSIYSRVLLLIHHKSRTVAVHNQNCATWKAGDLVATQRLEQLNAMKQRRDSDQFTLPFVLLWEANADHGPALFSDYKCGMTAAVAKLETDMRKHREHSQKDVFVKSSKQASIICSAFGCVSW